MAREMLLRCDRCDKRNGGKIVVSTIESRTSDGRKWVVDLCDRCTESMNKEFGWRALDRSPRRGFAVLDDVPKSTLK